MHPGDRILAVRRKSDRKVKPAGIEQAELKFPAPANEKLDIPALETWLWDAACEIRGATDAPKFKDFILPLIFYNRITNAFWMTIAYLD